MHQKSNAHNALLNSLLGPRIDGKVLVSPDVVKKISAEISHLELTNAKMANEAMKRQRSSRSDRDEANDRDL